MKQKKYLIIRQDNIGDLVCTIPLLNLLSQQSNVKIDMLVNSYNAAVICHHPDIHQMYVHIKTKHRAHLSRLRLYWQRFKQMLQLRRNHYDIVFIAQKIPIHRINHIARCLAPKKLVFFSDKAHVTHSQTALLMATGKAEAEIVTMLAIAINCPLSLIPPCTIYPDLMLQKKAKNILQKQRWYQNRTTIAVHISARKPSQRWTAGQFIDLMQQLTQAHSVQFMLFWSPGAPNNPFHPGDDEKAHVILQNTRDLAVLPCPTQHLAELIANLSICDVVICSDGGAMHIAAGLNKPIVCFFGQSDPVRWRPWGVPYQLIRPPSRLVQDITVLQVINALELLLKTVRF